MRGVVEEPGPGGDRSGDVRSVGEESDLEAFHRVLDHEPVVRERQSSECLARERDQPDPIAPEAAGVRRLVQEHGQELDRRWRRNVVLNKWLDYLSEQGHLVLERQA